MVLKQYTELQVPIVGVGEGVEVFVAVTIGVGEGVVVGVGVMFGVGHCVGPPTNVTPVPL